MEKKMETAIMGRIGFYGFIPQRARGSFLEGTIQ